MTAYEYVKNHVNVKVSPSIIHGVGIFALRDIEKGEDLFVNWMGETGLYQLTEFELNSLDYDVKMHLYDMFSFFKNDIEWTFGVNLEKNCHWIYKTPIHWVNSCPWDGEPNFDKDLLVTTKKIYRGNELFTKYGKYEKIKQLRTI